MIGGYAVIYHGYVRTTGDMNVWIAVDRANAKRIAAVLDQFGFGDGITAEMFLKKGEMFRMGRPPVRIELLTEVSGIDFATAYRSRVTARLEGVDVAIISLEDLKANKKATGRAKDLADLENLP